MSLWLAIQARGIETPRMTLPRFVISVFSLTFLFVHASAATWPVTLDGKVEDAQWFSLSETSDKLVAGDVLFIAGVAVLVRETDNLNFINALSSKARLYRILPSGRKEVIAFYPDFWKGKGSAPKLKGLSQKEIEGLWGVGIDGESGNNASLIQGDKTFVDISHTAWKKLPVVLPKLPCRAIDIEWNGEPDERLYALFSDATRWVSLDVSLNVVADKLQVKCEPLLRARNLKWLRLRLRMEELDNPDALAQFRNLRYFYYSHWEGLKTLSFVEGMKDLREIYAPGNEITSITPLAGLPQLRVVDVHMTPLADLPEDGFPMLSRLNLQGTTVPAGAVENFRKRHPDCVVKYEWAADLRRVVADADRFIVRTGGTCHRQYAKEKIIFETKKRPDMDELLSLIAIDEKKSDSVCMCCGSPTMEFYKNGKLIAMVGIQHGSALRWAGWPADAVLTKESVKQFTEWLKVRGVKEPSEAIEKAKAQGALIEAALKAQGKQ